MGMVAFTLEGMSEPRNPAEPWNLTEPWSPTVRWSRGEDERAGTDLIVFLHGYGANEHDLFPLAQYLPPRYTVASVRAPMAMELGGVVQGYTWFPLAQDMGADAELVRRATVDLQSWVAAQRSQFRSTTLLGFSMGMVMATSLLRMEPTAYDRIVGLSGFVINTDPDSPAIRYPVDDALRSLFHDDDVAAARPAVFWGRDPQDPIIPAEQVGYAGEWLGTHVDLTAALYSGVGHGIHPNEVQDVVRFLEDSEHAGR